jgi:hypothetical protein
MASSKVPQSVNRRRLRAGIDEAGQSFGECWQTLVAMKGLAKLDGNALLAFQPNLAAALFKLDDLYRKLIENRKVLIRNKSSYSTPRFTLRMRWIANDLRGVRSAIDIGRSLGDAFAWMFYKHDQPLLEQHFKQPLNPHTPPGIGGIGELEFIRQARPAGFFMLYHGITTFLRIGDVSFYDLETGRVASTAELKSRRVAPGRLTVTAHVMGKPGKKIPFVDPNTMVRPENNRPKQSVGDFEFAKRLETQMKRIEETVLPEPPTHKSELLDAYHIDEVSKFGRELVSNGLAYQQIGKGLLLAGSHTYRGRSLSSRIFSKASDKSVVKRMRRFPEYAIQIADPALTDNSIIFSPLDHAVRIGSPPLFWFPCDIDFLEALYFLRITAVSVYNPAHLFKELRSRGCEVIARHNANGVPAFEVTKKMPNAIMGIEQFDFFLRLIQQRFMREEKVLEVLEKGLTQLPQLNPGGAARLEYGFIHLF